MAVVAIGSAGMDSAGMGSAGVMGRTMAHDATEEPEVRGSGSGSRAGPRMHARRDAFRAGSIRDRLVSTSLAMPLRDMARGLMAAGQASHELLPPPLRGHPAIEGAFRRANGLATRVGARVFGADAPGPGDIRLAATFRTNDARALKALVCALAFAVERVIAEHPDARLLVSETVALAALGGRRRSETDRASRAGAIAHVLHGAHAIAPAPGTPLPPASEGDAALAMRALFAATLWLLAERPADAREEPVVLELCVRLAEGMQDELREAFASPDALASMLDELVGII